MAEKWDVLVLPVVIDAEDAGEARAEFMQALAGGRMSPKRRSKMLVVWDKLRRRVVQIPAGERHPNIESLGAMPLADVDGYFYTGPLRTSRGVLIRREGAEWVIDFHYRSGDESGWRWEHGHVRTTWLSDALAEAGSIALAAADYNEEWARAAIG